MSKAWTILAVLIPTIGIVLAAWLVSRWEPMSGATVVFKDIRAIEINSEANNE